MELMMLFGNEVIDKIKIDSKKVNTPDYIVSLEELLIARNEESLNFCTDEPHFAFERLSQKTNNMSYQALM